MESTSRNNKAVAALIAVIALLLVTVAGWGVARHTTGAEPAPEATPATILAQPAPTMSPPAPTTTLPSTVPPPPEVQEQDKIAAESGPQPGAEPIDPATETTFADPTTLALDPAVDPAAPHAPATTPPPASAVQVANPLNFIGALSPTGSFSMTGPWGVPRADYDRMAYQLPLNPPGPQASMVRWVDGWGVAPQHAQHGTLYILGHAWAQQKLVFNGVSEKVAASVNTGGPAQMVPAYGGGQVPRWPTTVLNGTRIYMNGHNHVRREWIVDNAYLIRKTDSINDIELNNAHIPGRIVLLTCAVGGGRDLPFNVIVTGHLA
ncbi:hypothetical protein ACFSSC_06090 [Corynebacterium mendelii]|uniref:Sortase n=1 Tax=Corynebacterium mendelii TaxID=2765362 RepID=A0A939E174_9CORY|nr:hypothetical protein [Corynebacterium mendelii]MBN9644549.1 hypothetical protein [Corynebacterium mendelii]